MKNIIQPYWKDTTTAICMASSNEYAKYLCVYLMSLKVHACEEKNYDIIVLERDISDNNKRLITESICSNNITVRFYNPSEMLNNAHMHLTHSYFKEECYYRICAPVVLNTYSKIIFTDIDIILQDDILKLSEVEMKNAPIAACEEPVWKELYGDDMTLLGKNVRDYTHSVLKLPEENVVYYNTGVLIYDVERFNQLNSFNKLLKLFNGNYFLYQEQCALNRLFNGQFAKLSPIWNFELATGVIENPKKRKFYDDYKEYEHEAKIIHFLGSIKPWLNPREYLADLWWSYARITPFYEEILKCMLESSLIDMKSYIQQLDELCRYKTEISQIHLPNIEKTFNAIRKEFEQIHFPNINNRFAHNERELRLLFVMNNLTRFRLMKFKLSMMRLFSVGDRHRSICKRYIEIKSLIREATMKRKRLYEI